MQLAFDLQRSQMDNLFFVRSSHTCHARETLLWSLVVWRCSRIDELFKHLKPILHPQNTNEPHHSPSPVILCHSQLADLQASAKVMWAWHWPVGACLMSPGQPEPLANLSEHNTPACLSWRGCSSPPVTATSQHLSILRLSWLIFLHPPLGQTLDQKNLIKLLTSVSYLWLPPIFLQLHASSW